MDAIKLFSMLASLTPFQGIVKTGNEVEISDAVIVKELPIMHFKGDMEPGEKKVIRSQRELEWMFSPEDFESLSFLKDIDFSKYSLLLGVGTYFSQVKDMRHSFIRIAKKHYAYMVKVAGDMMHPDTFMYGSIVRKLPKGAKVSFKLDELNPF